MAEIRSGDELREWLDSEPRKWAHVIAVRAALRALPISLSIAREQKAGGVRSASALFGVTALAYAACNFPSLNLGKSVLFSTFLSDRLRLPRHSSTASISHALYAVSASPDPGYYSYDEASAAAYNQVKSEAAIAAVFADMTYADVSNDAAGALWAAVSRDCSWITAQEKRAHNSEAITGQSLWLATTPKFWIEGWERTKTDLLIDDFSFQVWIDWFDRRVNGERAAFDIPGDKGHKEDKAILARIAEATDEDFWSKGAHHVNTALQGWIDEARARAAAESSLPEQEDGATAYGLNDAGKVDRLPAGDQQHLRDAPDQRRNYADIRHAAQELAEEGQRLGARLRRALDRFITSLPETFEQAEAYPVWRDGNALRRIYRAHRLVADSREPDDARLDPMVGEALGGLIDLYNLFAFGDDGLRTLDERRVAAQERARADVEWAAAKPLVDAALRAPDIASPRALDDLKAEAEAETLPPGDPYADQAADQASRVRRNWFAALLWGGKRALDELKKSGKSAREGAERAVGATIVSDLTGVTQIYRPVLDFIKDNAEALKNYASIAYNSPAVAHLIDAIFKLWPF